MKHSRLFNTPTGFFMFWSYLQFQFWDPLDFRPSCPICQDGLLSPMCWWSLYCTCGSIGHELWLTGGQIIEGRDTS